MKLISEDEYQELIKVKQEYEAYKAKVVEMVTCVSGKLLGEYKTAIDEREKLGAGDPRIKVLSSKVVEVAQTKILIDSIKNIKIEELLK